MLYRPSVPQSLWFTENGKPELRHGFIVNQQAFMGFLREAQTAHKEYSWDHRVAWAAYNAYTHPNHRPAWIWRLLTGLLTVLLLASCVFAEPPNREAIVRRIVEIVMASPQGGPFGTPTLARMQIRSAGGAWVDLSATTGLPITCLSGCGGASAFLDNAVFVAGLTPVGITAGWFSNSPTACTSGSACAPSLTSDRKLFVQSFQGTSPWVVSANGGTFAVTQSGAWTVTTTPPSNASTNVAQWAGNTLGATSNYGTSPGAVAVPGVNAFVTNTPAVTLTSTTITGTVAVTESGNWTNRIVGNAGATLDSASGAALPTNSQTIAGRDSTQTGGGTAIPVVCDKSAFVNLTTATTTQIVALSGSTIIYVCGYVISNGATAQTVILKFGTGANCGTGTTSLTGTISIAVNSSISYGSGIGTVARTTGGQALCATTSGASVTTSVTVSYAQF